MREIVKIPFTEIETGLADVPGARDMPGSYEPPGELARALDKAKALLRELADPAGVFSEIATDEFAVVYAGESLNEPEAPLEKMFPRAEALALFAATLGPKVQAEATTLFASGEAAVGYFLDALASGAADRAAEYVQRFYERRLAETGRASPSAAVLRYSPGYCGWHISGQKKLFAYLKPEEIGVHLLESYLMEPLKSVSGVLVAGPKEIHFVRPTYPFCAECTDKSCTERTRALKSR